ncbi:hypothetical protein ACWCXK_37245 [Streptomyces sp. NPDC001739]
MFVLLMLAVGERTVLLPSIMAGVHPVALLMFTPVPVVVGLVMCLDSRLPSAEASGIRPTHLMDAALSGAAVTGAIALSLVIGTLIGSDQVIAAGRNTTFLVGIALCVRALAGQPAVMAPVGWIMLVVFFGCRTSSDFYPWTILPEPLNAGHAAAGASLAFVAGIAAQLRTSRNL